MARDVFNDPVLSVAGKSGAVTLDTSDVVGLVAALAAKASTTNTEYAFSSYRFLKGGGIPIGSAVAGDTYGLNEGGDVLAIPSAGTALSAFYLDPADYGAGARTKKVRLRAWVITNAVAPAINFVFDLYPVATWNGASNVRPGVASLGTSILSVPINTPTASGPTTGAAGDVTFPAAGYYILTVTTSNISAANSRTECSARLDMRQV